MCTVCLTVQHSSSVHFVAARLRTHSLQVNEAPFVNIEIQPMSSNFHEQILVVRICLWSSLLLGAIFYIFFRFVVFSYHFAFLIHRIDDKSKTKPTTEMIIETEIQTVLCGTWTWTRGVCLL